MPDPQNFDEKEDFMEVCVPYVIRHEDAGNEEAVAKCLGMWENKDKNRKE